jgi:RNA-directed DNA polymerase
VYLTPVDRMIEADRTVFVYARYVDDLLLFGESKEALRETRERLVRALAALRVETHPGKSRVYRSGDGVTFLGWRLLPEQTRLVRENVVRFRRRMTRLHREYHAGTMEWGQVKQSVQAWIGHAAHGDTWVLREQLLAGFAF